MPAKRLTLYLRDESFAVIGETREGELSTRVNAIIQRYGKLVREACPEFTESEWNAILDANNGNASDLTRAEGWASSTMIWANVADACSLDGLDRKWEIDGDALVSRLRQLSPAEMLAVEEVIIKFWNHCEHDNALELSGAKIK